MSASKPGVVCACCLACAVAAAQECTPRVVYSLGGEFLDGDAAGGLLALAQRRTGVLLLDIEPPDRPAELARVTPGDAERVALREGVLASVSGSGVVSFIDLVDPAAPEIIGGLATPATDPTDLLWLGAALYVFSPSTGAWVIDGADPSLPRLIGPIAGSTPALAVAHDGQTMLIARDDGVLILHAADPLHPTLLGTIPGRTDGIALRAPVAFTCLDNDLTAIDVSQPDNPRTLWTDQTDLTYSPRLAAVGDRLSWFRHVWDMASFDIADPTVRTPLTTRQRWLTPRALTHSGDTLITVGKTETRLSSPSGPSQTVVLDHLPVRNSTLWVVDGRAFCQAAISAVRIVDIADPTDLTTLHEIPNAACAWTDGVHMLSTRSDFQVWDVREGQTPTLLGGADLDAGVWDFAATQTLAFLLDDDDEFRVIDWSDPSHPQPLSAGAYPDAFAPYAVTPTGLLCGWDPGAFQLLFLDVTDPTNPVTAGAIPTLGMCFDANIQGDLLFTHERMVRVFDISDPASPRMLSVLPGYWGSHEGVVDADLFYQVGDPAVVWDLADPTRPALRGFIPDLPEVLSLARAGDHWMVIAANLDGELYSSLASARLEPASGQAMLGAVETIPAPDAAAALAGRGAFNASYPDGLWILDLADPEEPRILGRAVAQVSGPIEMDDRYTYFYTANSLCVLEGDSPANARIIGSVPMAHISSMHRKADRLYLTGGNSAFIVSIADPTYPRVLGSIGADQTVRGFDADGAIACLSLLDATLVFYDIADLNDIVELGRIRWGYEGGQVWFDDGLVVAAVGTANLCLFDAADPGNPTLASFVRGTDGPIRRFLVEGDTVHATARGSVMLFDIADRRNPRLRAEARNLADSVIPLLSNRRLFLAGFPAPVLLSIDPGCDACPADLNADGVVDTADLIAFLNAWSAQRGQFCLHKNCSADFDDNGVVDTRDFIAYLEAWAAGC